MEKLEEEVGGAGSAGQRWDSFSGVDSSYSAEPPFYLYKLKSSAFKGEHGGGFTHGYGLSEQWKRWRFSFFSANDWCVLSAQQKHRLEQ